MAERKQRFDSAAGASELLAASVREIAAPAHIVLRAGDLPFWQAIVDARAKEEWTDNDLAQAATLARALADLERLTAEIDGNETIANAKGNLVLNPLLILTDRLARRVMALRRDLCLDGRSLADPRDIGKRRKAALEVEEKTGDLFNDGLLAQPNVHRLAPRSK